MAYTADGVPLSAGDAVITDPADPRLAGYAHLTDRAARDRIEPRLGVFVVEGALALGQLLASSYRAQSILAATNRAGPVAKLVEGLDAPLYVAAPEVLRAVAGFDVHRGILALGERRPVPESGAVLEATAGSPVVIVEGVSDHENLGAIFRNAAAFGAGAVLADPTTCDPLYRRSIRVSLGHALRVPFARLSPWPAALADLRRAGWTTMALTPSLDAEPIDAVAARDLSVNGRTPERVALLVGAEGPGLRPETLAAADRQVRIRLADGVDSINVATALAIALHWLGAAGRV